MHSVICQTGSSRTCARPEGQVCVGRMTSRFCASGGGRGGAGEEVRKGVWARNIGFRDGWSGTDGVCYKERPGLV